MGVHLHEERGRDARRLRHLDLVVLEALDELPADRLAVAPQVEIESKTQKN